MQGKKWQEMRLGRNVPWVPCGKLELIQCNEMRILLHKAFQVR